MSNGSSCKRMKPAARGATNDVIAVEVDVITIDDDSSDAWVEQKKSEPSLKRRRATLHQSPRPLSTAIKQKHPVHHSLNQQEESTPAVKRRIIAPLQESHRPLSATIKKEFNVLQQQEDCTTVLERRIVPLYKYHPISATVNQEHPVHNFFNEQEKNMPTENCQITKKSYKCWPSNLKSVKAESSQESVYDSLNVQQTDTEVKKQQITPLKESNNLPLRSDVEWSLRNIPLIVNFTQEQVRQSISLLSKKYPAAFTKSNFLSTPLVSNCHSSDTTPQSICHPVEHHIALPSESSQESVYDSLNVQQTDTEVKKQQITPLKESNNFPLRSDVEWSLRNIPLIVNFTQEQVRQSISLLSKKYPAAFTKSNFLSTPLVSNCHSTDTTPQSICHPVEQHIGLPSSMNSQEVLHSVNLSKDLNERNSKYRNDISNTSLNENQCKKKCSENRWPLIVIDDKETESIEIALTKLPNPSTNYASDFKPPNTRVRLQSVIVPELKEREIAQNPKELENFTQTLAEKNGSQKGSSKLPLKKNDNMEWCISQFPSPVMRVNKESTAKKLIETSATGVSSFESWNAPSPIESVTVPEKHHIKSKVIPSTHLLSVKLNKKNSKIRNDVSELSLGENHCKTRCSQYKWPVIVIDDEESEVTEIKSNKLPNISLNSASEIAKDPQELKNLTQKLTGKNSSKRECSNEFLRTVTVTKKENAGSVRNLTNILTSQSITPTSSFESRFAPVPLQSVSVPENLNLRTKVPEDFLGPVNLSPKITEKLIFPAKENYSRESNRRMTSINPNTNRAISPPVDLSNNLSSPSMQFYLHMKGPFSKILSLEFSRGAESVQANDLPCLMIEWIPDWLRVQNGKDAIPPIWGENKIQKVKNTYASNGDYLKSYYGLHLLSIWIKIYNSWKPNPTIHRCKLIDFENKIMYFRNTCQAIMPSHAMPIPQSIILVISRNINYEIKCSFGYVEKMNSKPCTHSQRGKSDELMNNVTFSFCSAEKVKTFQNSTINIQNLCRPKLKIKQYAALNMAEVSVIKDVIVNPMIHATKIKVLHLTSNYVNTLQTHAYNIIRSYNAKGNVFTLVQRPRGVDTLPIIVKLIKHCIVNYSTVLVCFREVSKFITIANHLKYNVNIILAVKKSEVAMPAIMQQYTLRAHALKLPGITLDKAEWKVLRKSKVILTVLPKTFLGSCKAAVLGSKLTCIIDDAHLCSEAETALPLSYNPENVILMGDSSEHAKQHPFLQRLDYHISLYHRLFEYAE